MNLKLSILTLLAVVTFTACSKNKTGRDGVEGVPTYVNFYIALPGVATRALPEDYNEDGRYDGNDYVQTLDIYMRSADGTIEAKRFTGTDISSDGSYVAPSQPFRTTSGYKTVYIVLNDPDDLRTTITSEEQLVSTDNLARTYTNSNGVVYDMITMTGKSDEIYIDPDIPVQDVSLGTNTIEISVERVAAKVIVTTNASPNLYDEDGTLLGTVSNVTYSVAQGTNQIYWIAQPDYVSYAYDYVPVLGDYYGVADQYYDYSDLSTPSAVQILPTASDGYKALQGKYVFENTHAYGSTNSTTDYRKGNTAYVLVRAHFTPTASAIADGGTLTNGTFYVGQTDGLIYSSKAAAQAAVTNQKVAVYTGGKMLNYAWLNPDDIDEPLNSPVVRNNIYHINITGYSRLGYNWNPLYPEDPDTNNPSNPDPKPGNTDEPDSPIDPIDPLTPEETYMSVEVTVQDWWVHSYNIQF
ncbi:MAG: Mfa1 family fimbria major subunit [Rikenellaceae bacterium]|nr:Mfa1 family fimbria major subunit [Rikenellaceae bacterium]